MNKTKWILVGGLAAVGIVAFVTAYNKQPKAHININPDDNSGTITFNDQSVSFEGSDTPGIRTWSGWQLSANAHEYTLTKNGKMIENGTINQYSAGSSNVTITRRDPELLY